MSAAISRAFGVHGHTLGADLSWRRETGSLMVSGAIAAEHFMALTTRREGRTYLPAGS